MGRYSTTPDTTQVDLAYNDAGLLETVDAFVRGAVTSTAFVTAVDYDVHGRRSRIDYGNDTFTTYTYDPLTFRLTRLQTTRTSDSVVLQDLEYFFDPVGNITEVRDSAQQAAYFDNAVVSPDQRYEYDALYRLTHAEGREHTSVTQPTNSDFTPGPQPHPDDPSAVRSYTEDYLYDLVGNILQLQHTATSGNFTRDYVYATTGNRLLRNSAPGETVEPFSHTYTHDAHGNMTAMPHLAAIDWDHADRLQHADLGGGGDVYFVYDSGGQRIRKVQINLSGTTVTERIYLGSYELYRKTISGTLDTERETLHIADDHGRLCMLETKTVDTGTPVATPTTHSRYQYANHLGSAALELDGTAAIISYEEFHPFGTTSYAAKDSAIDVSAKRYRYIGKEHDDETGLYHLGARYYAAWLGRWTAADPIGLGDGVNRYAYASNNPIALQDRNGTKGKSGSSDDQTASDVAADVTQNVLEGAVDALATAVFGPLTIAADALDISTSREDVAEFAQQTEETIGEIARAAGQLKGAVTPDPFGTEAKLAELGTAATLGLLTIGAHIAGGFAQLPEKGAQAARTSVKAQLTLTDPVFKAELELQAAGEIAEAGLPLSESALVFGPGFAAAAERGAVAAAAQLDDSLPAFGRTNAPPVAPKVSPAARTVGKGRGGLPGPAKAPTPAAEEGGPLVRAADEVLEQALRNGPESIAGFRVFGNKGLVGDTFQRNVILIEAEVKGAAPLRGLVDALEAEARAAGAGQFRIVGHAVINKGFTPAVAKRFGFQFRRINDETIELTKALK